MNTLPAEIVAEVLERLDQGEAAEKIVASFPEAAEEVKSLLATLSALDGLSSRPYVSTRQKSREKFLDQAATMKATGETSATPAFDWSKIFRRLSLSVAMMFLLIVAGSLFSTSALPGDFLYGPKRALENMRMSLTSNSDAVDDLQEAFQAERLDEVRTLLRLGRTADVEFVGSISVITDEMFTVSDINILLKEDTRINGTPELRALVRINGYTEDGQLFADEITILAGDPFPVQVTPKPTPIIQTPEPAMEDIEQAADEETPTPTGTATPTPSRTPTPSPTATPTITASPTADDGDNDSDDSSGPGSGDDGTDEPEEEATDEPNEEATDEPDEHATDEPDDPEEPEEPGDD